MLSRIADSLYWMSRYMERADGMLRLMKTSYNVSFDNIQAGFPTWEPSLEIFTQLPLEKREAIKNDNAAALQYLLIDTENINSLKVLITRSRENARGAQDHVTREVWEQINHIYHLINQPDFTKKLAGPDAITILDTLSTSRELYSGVTDSTMPRGLGWSFMNVGKYIERSLLTVEFTNFFFKRIQFKLTSDQDILYWRILLMALSGYEMHLKNYRSPNNNRNVAEQVLFNGNFPRSLYYSLERSGKYLQDVAASNPVDGSAQLLKTFSRLNSAVKFAELSIVENDGIETFLQSIRQQLTNFSKLLGKTYFSYS